MAGATTGTGMTGTGEGLGQKISRKAGEVRSVQLGNTRNTVCWLSAADGALDGGAAGMPLRSGPKRRVLLLLQGTVRAMPHRTMHHLLVT